jgi:hypothetical protein
MAAMSAAYLDGPFAQALSSAADGTLIVPRLGPAIRALGAAASSESCCKPRAKELLAVVIAAHRRGKAAHERRYQHSASDALIVARALLAEIAGGGGDLFESHVGESANRRELLAEFLQAIAAAGEKNERAAETARQIWPRVMEQVINLVEGGRYPDGRGHPAASALAALIPTRAYAISYLWRKLEGEPIVWTDLLAWRRQVERWLPLAAGGADCVDSLVQALGALKEPEQAAAGLPWIAIVVQADPGEIARHPVHLPDHRAIRTPPGAPAVKAPDR